MSIFFPPYLTLDEAISLLSTESGANFTRDWVLQLVQHGEIKFYFRPQSDMYVQHELLKKSFLQIKQGREHQLPRDWAGVFSANANRDGKIRVGTLPDAMGGQRFIQDAKTDERVELAISLGDVRFSSDDLRAYVFNRKSATAPSAEREEHILDVAAAVLSSNADTSARETMAPPASVPVKKAVTFSTNAHRISVAAALELVLRSADFPPTLDVFMGVFSGENGNETFVPNGAVHVQPADGRGLAANFIKRSFIEFCASKHVSPKNPYAPWVLNYDSGNSAHDALYEVSVTEMQMFASGYGLEVEVLATNESERAPLEHSANAQPKGGASIAAVAMALHGNNDVSVQDIEPRQRSEARVHKLASRTHSLTSEIEAAKLRAIDKTDPASVFAELVKMAAVKEGCLLGTADGDIKYECAGEIRFFSKKNLGDRMSRRAR